ncbi:magnetochrome domain-containing protein [Planctomycetota bacterium]
MAGLPKQWIGCVFAGIPLVLVITVGLGLATGPKSHSEISHGYLSLAPVETSAPAMPMPAPPANAPVYLPRNQPMIAVNQTIPQTFRDPTLPEFVSPGNPPPLGRQQNTLTIADVPTTPQRPPAPASPARTPIHLPQIDPPTIDILPFQEGHWQGLEVIPLTQGVARVMKVPQDVKGVIVDDVTSPADMEGFLAGDVITEVGQVPTPTLESFIKAADRVRDRRRTEIQVLRKNEPHSLVLTALQKRLGTANGETAPMIRPGSRPPHGYMGACTNCHHIGTTGQLAVDNGDLLTRAAPPIRAGQMPPHRDRGACTACHTMIR